MKCAFFPRQQLHLLYFTNQSAAACCLSTYGLFNDTDIISNCSTSNVMKISEQRVGKYRKEKS